MRTITRIDPASAMKVGALLSALSFTIFGLLFFAMQAVIFNAITSSITTSGGISTSSNISSSGMVAFGVASLCLFYGVGVVGSTISGAIGGVVLAFLYNLTANWVGGLKVQFAEDAPRPKAKRSVVIDSIEEDTTF